MKETNETSEKEVESNQIRGSEQTNLDEVTHEPRAHVEESGDYHQAEAIQKSLEKLTESAAEKETPISQPEGEGLTEEVSVRGDLDRATTGGEGNKDEATPINLPGPQATSTIDLGETQPPVLDTENESGIGGQPAVRGDLDQATTGSEGGKKDEATPINLPGPQTANATISSDDTNFEKSEGGRTGNQTISEEEPEPSVSSTATGQWRGSEIPPGELPALEEIPTDDEMEADSEGELPPPDEGTQEGDEHDDTPDWYLHKDKDGNITVVDENGNPVDSPPKIVNFNGKNYAIYPGDELPIKADGSVTDPEKLAEFEISSYKASGKGMQIYSDNDGNPVVVDENGHPVGSPPSVIQDPTTGKYYFITETDPGKLSSFTKSGNFAEALSKGLISEAPDYKASGKGMKIYSDTEGNPVVVDKDGHPVDSPPAVIQDPATGKYYFVTETDPGKLSSFTKSGNFAEALSKGLISEAPDYKASSKGMKIYSDTEGNPVVVDKDGHPVDSPPAVIQDPATGKYYFVTETDPGKLSSFTKSGNFAEALSKGQISEAPDYKASSKGMKIYSDNEGNPVVVDENGHPVDSPPAVIQDPATGKYYFVTETDPGKLSSFTKSGNFTEALSKGLISEASDYKASSKGMKIYPDNDGNPVVVDKDGHPVDSPPSVIQDPTTGKYYFITETDPGKLSSFTKSGNFAEALSKGLISEASYYKPPGWGGKPS